MIESSNVHARSVTFQDTLDRPIRTGNDRDTIDKCNANRYCHWTPRVDAVGPGAVRFRRGLRALAELLRAAKRQEIHYISLSSLIFDQSSATGHSRERRGPRTVAASARRNPIRRSSSRLFGRTMSSSSSPIALLRVSLRKHDDAAALVVLHRPSAVFQTNRCLTLSHAGMTRIERSVRLARSEARRMDGVPRNAAAHQTSARQRCDLMGKVCTICDLFSDRSSTRKLFVRCFPRARKKR